MKATSGSEFEFIKQIETVPDFLIDKTSDENERAVLKQKFIDELYPTLTNSTEADKSLKLTFNDGMKDSSGNYVERALIVSPVMLNL